MISRRQFLSYSALCTMGTLSGFSLLSCADSAASTATTATNSGTDTEGSEEARTLLTFLFDTVINIKAYCSQEVLDLVEERLIYFENTFSRTIAGSDIYRINQAEGQPTSVSAETLDIVSKALSYCELSDGLFDITIGGVVDLWDFAEQVVPEPNELAEALTHVDYRGVTVEGNTITLADPKTHLDLGAIAKGYITDDIVALMKEQGCESALINLGGNTYALGSRPDGSNWRVGIQDPNGATGSVCAIIPVSDTSVVTSGINERCFTKDGIFYHHLLDPRTGMPAETDLASASIISDFSLDGDAFSTITFLEGVTEGMALAQEYGGLKLFFVDKDGSTSSTDGLEIEDV